MKTCNIINIFYIKWNYFNSNITAYFKTYNNLITIINLNNYRN